MQVTVEKKEGIHCELAIEVPFIEIDKEVTKRLQKIAKTAKFDGFRPGKVPVNFVKKRYGEEIRFEVIGDVLPQKYVKAIQDESLNAAGVEIDIKHNKEGEDLKFTVHVELYPEIEVSGLDQIEVEKPLVAIGDVEVEKMIDNLRKQVATWKTVEREAKDGDTVVIDFVGTKDGEEFGGGSAKDQNLVLGSGQMIPGFEAGVIGMKKADIKTIDVTFPEDYQSVDLAGKEVQFEITLNEVKEAELPEINEEFAKKFGVDGDVEAFYTEIRGNMDRELRAAIKKAVKEQIFDGLKKTNEVEVPKTLIQNEIKRAKEDLMKRMGGNDSQVKLEDIPDDLFKDASEARIKLGLIVNAIVEKNKLEASNEKVTAMIEEMASVYEDAEEVKAHYRDNEKDLENIKGAVVEDELVEFVLSQAKVTEKETDFFELIRTTMANSQMQ